jgi:hypothetical protein
MRLVLAALVAFTPSIAAADPLSMTAATHGSTLDLTFTNTTTKPVTMTTHVRAGLDHFDSLKVKLTGKATRKLEFYETRTKAIPVEATIAPGASIDVHVDLALWAIRWDKGDPLAADSYALEATWEATSPKLKLVATTKLVVPAAKEASCKDSSTKGIELLAHQVGQGTTKTPVLEVGLYNKDTVPHCVHGIIKTHETQSDWLRVEFGDKAKRTLRFDDDRDKSAPQSIELAPGATYWTKWDLGEWAKRKRNGGKPAASGTVWMDVTFDATRERDVWHGAIKTALGFVFP